MRILGVTEHWPKLLELEFTTFRMRRRDRDWQVGEEVQVVYKPRSKEREVLGVAKIVEKEPKSFKLRDPEGNYINEQDAREDGFEGLAEMEAWFYRTHGMRAFKEPINKLTLRWVDGKTRA
ncbi:hypothetical protein ES708_11845 [subsurface metagenome]